MRLIKLVFRKLIPHEKEEQQTKQGRLFRKTEKTFRHQKCESKEEAKEDKEEQGVIETGRRYLFNAEG